MTSEDLKQIGNLLTQELAPINQRLTNLEQGQVMLTSALISLDAKVSSLDAKVSSLDAKVSKLDKRVSNLEQGQKDMEKRLIKRIAEEKFDLATSVQKHFNEIGARFDGVDAKIDELKQENSGINLTLKSFDFRMKTLEAKLVLAHKA